MGTAPLGVAASGRDRASAAARRRSARRCARRHAADLRARRLEDGQPRQSSRRPHDPHRLGRSRTCAGLRRARVVHRAQPPPPATKQRGDHRRLSGRARAPRHRHRPMVGRPDRALALGRGGAVRMGEGQRRGRRDRVVGGARPRGSATSRMTISAHELQEAYGGGAGAWAAGPAAIYRRMAEPLVTMCPIPLAGACVVDFGAGTGATTAAITAAGAEVVGVDLTLDMLRADRAHRPPAVNADATRLPFRARSFDAAMGAFVLSHIPAPIDALAEATRVVRPGGAVLTVGFDGRWEFAAKETVDRVMDDFGFRRPEWYDRFKREVEPLTAFPDRLSAVAEAAGLVDVHVEECAVDVGVHDTAGIV